MSSASRRIAAAAPGQWSIAVDHDNQSIVQVQFAGARNGETLHAQLERWAGSMRALAARVWTHAHPAPLALAVVHRSGTGAPWLQLDVPAHVGADGLPVDRTPHDILAMLETVARQLDALHAQQVVHGGLGLPSLWWMPDGALKFPDVGLTHSLEGVADAPPLAAGYRSPEVWHGRGIVPASDQYSLAAIAFELLSGKQRVVEEGTEGITSINPLVLDSGAVLYPGASPALSQVMQRALSASPSSRYPSCAAFIDALEGHIVLPESLPTLHRIFRRVGGGARWRSVVLGTVAVASVVASIWAIGGIVAPSRFAVRLPSLRDVDRSVLPPPNASNPSTRALGSGSTAPTTSGGTTRAGAPASAGVQRSLGRNTTTSQAPRPGQRPNQTPSGEPTMTAGVTPQQPTRSPSGAVRDSLALGSRARTLGDRVTSTVSGAVRSVTSPARSAASPSVLDSDAGSLSTSSGDASRLPATTPAGRLNATRGGAATTPTNAAAPATSPTTGSIQLQVPSGSRIYLDGVLQRPVADRITAPLGSHDVDIVSPSGQRVRRRVTVLGGETVVVR